MIKRLLCVALATLALAISSMAENKEDRKLNDSFSTIEVTKGVNVLLVQCDKLALEILTDGGPTSDVETILNNGTLTVKMKRKTSCTAAQVTVYFKDLEHIIVKRGATLNTPCLFKRDGSLSVDVGAQSKVELDIEVDELTVDGNTCNVDVTGKCNKQTVKLSGVVGSATYSAITFDSKVADIKVISANAEVMFSDSLIAEAINGTIKYTGDPNQVQKTEKAKGEVIEY